MTLFSFYSLKFQHSYASTPAIINIVLALLDHTIHSEF